MQDKSYAIAIVVVLGICCLGVYVAVSGYLNSNSPAPGAITPGIQATQVIIAIPTDSPAPTQPMAALPGAPTVVPIPSPIGAFQTIAAAATIVVATPPPAAPKPSPPPSPTPVPPLGAQQCGNFQFCTRGGLPDADLAPTATECPRNYIWGRIVDIGGKGIPNMRVRYRIPDGGFDTVWSKGPPDPAGAFNIPVSAGTWTVWLVDERGAALSPQFTITMPQGYPGTGNCPTRVDFFQQK